MRQSLLKQWLFPMFLILLFSGVSYAGVLTEVVLNKSAIVNLKKPSERISIANPAVADVLVISPTQLQINGKALGTTTLLIWEQGEKASFFDINVIPDISSLEARIKEIPSTENVTVSYANEYIVLSGAVPNGEIRNKVFSLASAYAKEGTSLETTKYSPGFTEVIKEKKTQIMNFVTIADAQQVMLEVKVAQIDKTKLKELGISYFIKDQNFEVTSPGLFAQPEGTVGNSINSAGLVSTETGSGIQRFLIEDVAPQIGFTHFPSDIAVVLRALASKGYAKILAEPNLTVRSGEKGNFLAGTRVPIQVVVGAGGSQTSSIVFEQVGVRLNFAPEVLDTGVIRLKIDPAEVSAITTFIQFASGISAPQIATREVRTSVDLREGESLVLAGLLDERARKNLKKVPILGDIPILGVLFRSTEEEIDNTELAFFITPRLVKPMAPGVKPELPAEKPLSPAEEKELQWVPGLK